MSGSTDAAMRYIRDRVDGQSADMSGRINFRGQARVSAQHILNLLYGSDDIVVVQVMAVMLQHENRMKALCAQLKVVGVVPVEYEKGAILFRGAWFEGNKIDMAASAAVAARLEKLAA